MTMLLNLCPSSIPVSPELVEGGSLQGFMQHVIMCKSLHARYICSALTAFACNCSSSPAARTCG